MTWTPATATRRQPGPPEFLAYEMRSARHVQTSLLPRSLPHMSSLEYAACSLPGRAVGGDFYDFLTPQPGRLALIQGDISGKGVPAALMMAALQSTLRSHYAVSQTTLERKIESVNRLFFECTASEHYATLFAGEYDDASRRLRYASCGHIPPLIVHDDFGVTRLLPTATVLGLFPEWSGSVGEATLHPGDTLVLATDGILEATSSQGQEFGEARMIAVVRRCRDLPPAELTREIIGEARRFSGNRPALDDQTVLVARVRSPAFDHSKLRCNGAR